ncbi:transcriptional regulator [Gordonia sp. HY002]|uniref:helix-turn-helix transcriptional regulator n=1 Tax=Gordonia zhenghanii TaxID=2911516 RepID=UPI001EF114B5|nr:transcriptional regulator [Gordonia zhenghanii]MCF8572112.1 transcriptional regulator [Gordonia zhenghanii]MCF8602986.1 transcriptional regulator [Gordonia zhenghanii]
MNNSPRPLGPDPAPSVAPDLTAAQRATLDALRGDGPARVVDVAARLGLHTNTIREHLDALVGLGVATRMRAESAGRGRPAWRYAAVAADGVAVRAYTGMAVALAGHLRRTAADPAAQARQLGRDWGRDLASGRPRTDGDSRTQILAHLTDFGFAPVDESTTIALTRCPLLDAARRYPDITCQIHRGLVQGSLDALGDTRTRPVLIPFAARGSCTLRLDQPQDGERGDR